MLLTSSCIYLFQNQVFSFFTTDPVILEVASDTVWLIALGIIGDGYRGMLNGPMRALGLQMRAATTILILQWFVNIPLMVYFSRELEWGIEGLWAGKIIVTYLIMIVYILVLELYDWEIASKESNERQTLEIAGKKHE